ncbi:MAG: fumarylacetoacetate hydrolase family protein [Dehalococcoidia bacterium]|nr:fumarylacetoacetate hydrolase family protein [Dehalococcoidia bacterium]
MAITIETINRISGELIQAEQVRKPLTSSASSRYPELTQDDGYAIQFATLETRLAAGARVIGAKAAFTSKATQQPYGVHEPVAGLLLDTIFLADGADIEFSALIAPRIEAEIAFVLDEELRGPCVNASRALAAVAGVRPALEIVDCRFEGWKVKATDVAADSACGSRVVVGGDITPIGDMNLRLLGVIIEKNGELVSTGAGAAALGNPVDVLVWLANKLAEFGRSLQKGDTVITGCLVPAEPFMRGDSFTASFDRLGSVSARIV